MRKIREVLRLYFAAALSIRAIARSVGTSPSTVADYLRRAEGSGLSWPVPEAVDDAWLERRLFPALPPSSPSRPLPEWSEVHRELGRKGVTLSLLWQEYKALHPEGLQYSWFCEQYRAWAAKLDLVMRQEHRAGEKLFVDYAGQTVPVVDPETGKVREAQVFVAVLGASSYTFAEATWTQTLPDWTASHVRAFEFFGGCTELVIPDNLRSGVSRADRYEPDLNPSYHDLARHYGVAVLPTRVRRPRDTAKAEVAVQVVERWILAALRHRTFFSLAELNEPRPAGARAFPIAGGGPARPSDAWRTQQTQMSFSRMMAGRPDRAATVRSMSARSRTPRDRNASAMEAVAGGGGESLGHPRRHFCRPQPLEFRRADGGLDRGDRLRGHVVLAEIPEGGERGARRLAGELQPLAVRGVDHSDRDVGDPDGAARCAGMEHGRRRHLGAELEPARSFRAVDLDRLAIVPRDGLDHLEDVGERRVPTKRLVRGRTKTAAGKTLDFAPAGEARKRPVDGAARAVLQKALVRERLSLRQLAYAGSNGSCGGHGMTLRLSEIIVILWTGFKRPDVACWSRVQCTARTPDATTTSSPARPGGRRPVSPGRPVRRARRRSPGSARACHGHRPAHAFRIQAAVINGRQQRLPFVERPSSLHALESRPLHRLARCPNNRWTRTRRVAKRVAACGNAMTLTATASAGSVPEPVPRGGVTRPAPAGRNRYGTRTQAFA